MARTVICSRKITGSNPGRATDSPDSRFSRFSSITPFKLDDSREDSVQTINISFHILPKCEILGSHRGVAEDSVLLDVRFSRCVKCLSIDIEGVTSQKI